MPNRKSKGLFSMIFILGISLVGCGVIQSKKEDQTTTKSKEQVTNQSENKKFETYLKETFVETMEDNSVDSHYMLKNPEKYGINKKMDTMGSLDPKELKSQEDEIKKEMNKLSKFKYESLSKEQQQTYDVLKDYLNTQKNLARYPYYLNMLGSTAGIQNQIPITLGEYRLDSKEDVASYFQLLASVDNYLDSVYSYMKEQIKQDTFMADISLEQAKTQIDSLVSAGENSSFIGTFVERIKEIKGMSQEEKQEAISKNETIVRKDVLPAFEKLGQQLEALRGSGSNQGLAYTKKGKAYYKALISSKTGSSKSMNQIIDICDVNLRRAILETKKIYQNNSKVYQQFTGKNISTYTGRNPKKMLVDLKKYTNRYYPKAPKVNYTIKYVHESMEGISSPAFYMIPAIDDYKDNVIYINQSKMNQSNTLYSTLAHEGYPGHLYQTVYFASKKDELIRYVLSYPGYTEGWATYVEVDSFKSVDAGSMSNDLTKLNHYRVELNLAICSRVDMGVHYEGWTKEKAEEFLDQYGVTGSSKDSIYEEVISNPGNYLSYYMGYKEFQELKDYYKEKAGKRYKLKTYHKIVLDAGPCSFDILKKRIDETL